MIFVIFGIISSSQATLLSLPQCHPSANIFGNWNNLSNFWSSLSCGNKVWTDCTVTIPRHYQKLWYYVYIWKYIYIHLISTYFYIPGTQMTVVLNGVWVFSMRVLSPGSHDKHWWCIAIVGNKTPHHSERIHQGKGRWDIVTIYHIGL